VRTQKVSLSLDSACVNQGLKRQVLADRQAELLGGWEKEFGPIQDDEIEEMARLWPD
jgi:hypothetical protein